MSKYYLKTYFSVCFAVISLSISAQTTFQQNKQSIYKEISNEVAENHQLEQLAFELLDVIGPRLVGSPEMEQAHNWVVNTYKKWNIEAENVPYGEWKSWQRGTTEITMTAPRVKSIEGIQLAWNATTKKPVEAEVVAMPIFPSKLDFEKWAHSVKGKIVLIAPYQKSGRPENQWKEHATEDDFASYKKEKEYKNSLWNNSLKATEKSIREIVEYLETKGAVGFVQSYFTGTMGSNRIFYSFSKHTPMVDVSLEDYGLLHRLAVNEKSPILKINTQSKKIGTAKTYNTIATIPGKTKPNEYVMLSAHLDSWDGAQGATDNGTGTILMMEVARLIKKYAPNNDRTIVIGHWGSEEQGLNGSRAYVMDHPSEVQKIKVLFNQDSGTGRITYIGGQGFTQAYNYLGTWLQNVPEENRKYIKTDFPGMPQTGGTDNASFVAAGIPAFNLGTQNWDYGQYTWHTNRDTYDKIVFEEMMKNVITTTILTLEAANDPNEISNEKRILPANSEWPTLKEAKRNSREY
ncbi:M28 family peptidase [Flavobacterium sp. CBA20B-1]|uniref:M28 family peptidase n=1 Tax=unclassified Flavobacterium TaxID=196869 RepID=UPI002225AD9E|nr:MULTISPECIES: M28 family peptidase [unclassified Flavobacterium]WCM42072.1 M28 family peptidase [Flavobacterium sp. CBA20B-1]